MTLGEAFANWQCASCGVLPRMIFRSWASANPGSLDQPAEKAISLIAADWFSQSCQSHKGSYFEAMHSAYRESPERWTLFVLFVRGLEDTRRHPHPAAA